MKMHIPIVLSVLIPLFSGWANEVLINPGGAESSTDLFQGATVTSSANIDYSTKPQAAFGLVPEAYEKGTVIANNNATGRIEFDPGTVAVQKIIFTLASDGEARNRSTDELRLYADTGAGWELVAQVNPLIPYHEYYGNYIIHAIVTLDTVVTSDTWAVEWDSMPGYLGARLREVDAFGAPPPPPAVMIHPAVEIGFTTVSGAVYTVQYCTNMVSTNWTDLGAVFTGDGSTNYMFDTTREGSKRYYQVTTE